MLSYDIIIKTLTPIVNTFSLQPNILLKSSEFTCFNKLFDDSFYRYGVYNNCSLKSSILYCMDLYHNIVAKQQNDHMTPDYINEIIPTSNIKEIVANLNINIIIFDFNTKLISSEYKTDYFNPWYPTIYLAKYNDWWEPIVTKDTKIFSFSSAKSSILKNNILMENITRYMTDIPITINDNFNEIIEIEGFINDPVNTTDLFIKTEPYTKNKLEKMKKDELIQICQTLNKKIGISKPTKKDLIELICII